MLLYDWLRANAKRLPNKPAALFCAVAAGEPGHSITFAELDARSDAVAAHLQSVGIGPGDRVALLNENSLPALCWFWGVLKVGASTVDLPGLAGKATLAGALEESKPKAIAINPAQIVKQCKGDAPLVLPELVFTTEEGREAANEAGLKVTTLESILETSGTPQAQEHDPDEPALVVYTSGTTGRPNGVMLSHRNFSSNLIAGNEMMGLTENDSILVVVPLHYIHGRMQLLWHMMIGGTVVFSAGFAFPQKVLQELTAFETTGFSGVPYHFKQLLDRSKLIKTPPPTLRYVLITGGALAAAELERLNDALPNTGIHLAYGQTEASPRITYIGPDDLFRPEKKGSVGVALPGTTLEILDGKEQPLGPNVVGEVAAGGPNIMLGYVGGDHVELGKIDAAGRLRTGDLGRIDEDGHLFLAGRSSEMIKSAGERIFPQEIEEVLGSHPRVEEVAVIGVKDPLLGERVVAYLKLTEGEVVESSSFKAHCLDSMPFVRVPKAFIVRDALPKTGSGKISRGALRKEAAENPPT